jgi:hypothetical protein
VLKSTLRVEDVDDIIEEDFVHIKNEDVKEAEPSRPSDVDMKEEVRNSAEGDLNKEFGVLRVAGLFIFGIELLGATLLSMGLLIYWLQ